MELFKKFLKKEWSMVVYRYLPLEDQINSALGANGKTAAHAKSVIDSKVTEYKNIIKELDKISGSKFFDDFKPGSEYEMLSHVEKYLTLTTDDQKMAVVKTLTRFYWK